MVNALSKHMQVNVYQDGKIYQQEYARGKVLYDLKVIGETERTGTTIRFWPDVKAEDDPNGIFETGDFQYDVLKTRFREMAFLNRGIRIVFRDERRKSRRRTSSTTKAASASLSSSSTRTKRFFCGADLHQRPRRHDERRGGDAV